FDVAMHNTARFCGDQRTRGLLNYFQCQGKRHWPITAHTGFECFALDKLHGIETFAILLSVISHPGNIWMMNIRDCARFAKESGSRAGILRRLAIDNLEGNNRIQNRITSAVSYGHCSRAELDRKTIRADLNFEVGIFQLAGGQTTPPCWSFRVFALCQKAEANETTQALAVRTALGQRSSTCSASSRSLSLSFHIPS